MEKEKARKIVDNLENRALLFLRKAGWSKIIKSMLSENEKKVLRRAFKILNGEDYPAFV